MCSKKGFTLIELIIALFILQITLPLWLYLFRFLINFDPQLVKRQNNIGLIQLRRIVALGKDYEVYSDELCMNYQDEKTCFYEVNNRLIQTPGTQIFMLAIENCTFHIDDQFIVLSYLSQDIDFEEIIGFIS